MTFCFHHLGGIPIRLWREEFIVPLFLCREVISTFHPLRFQPKQVTWEIHAAHLNGITQDIELVLQHVWSETKTISILRQQIGSAGDKRIVIDDAWHIISYHHIEVGLIRGIIDRQRSTLKTPYIKKVLPSCIVEDAPPIAAHQERLWNLCMLIGDPHPKKFATMLDMLTACRPPAIKTLTGTETKIDNRAFTVISGLHGITV